MTKETFIPQRPACRSTGSYRAFSKPGVSHLGTCTVRDTIIAPLSFGAGGSNRAIYPLNRFARSVRDLPTFNTEGTIDRHLRHESSAPDKEMRARFAR